MWDGLMADIIDGRGLYPDGTAPREPIYRNGQIVYVAPVSTLPGVPTRTPSLPTILPGITPVPAPVVPVPAPLPPGTVMPLPSQPARAISPLVWVALLVGAYFLLRGK